MQGMFTRLATERLNALALRFPAVIILGAQFWGQILLCASSERERIGFSIHNAGGLRRFAPRLSKRNPDAPRDLSPGSPAPPQPVLGMSAGPSHSTDRASPLVPPKPGPRAHRAHSAGHLRIAVGRVAHELVNRKGKAGKTQDLTPAVIRAASPPTRARLPSGSRLRAARGAKRTTPVRTTVSQRTCLRSCRSRGTGFLDELS